MAKLTYLKWCILIFGIFFSFYPLKSQDLFTNSKGLLYTTTKLVCHLENDTSKKTENTTGTAFFFDFGDAKKGHLPFIVTNKHVIEDSKVGFFKLMQSDNEGNPTEKSIVIKLDEFENRWLIHPDSTIDLAVMPIAPLMNAAMEMGFNLHIVPFDKSLIPDDAFLERFLVVERINFIGYPIGLSDTVHNIPIIRSGYNATPINIGFNGRDEFLIDASCFPGSSGSPVFIFDRKVELNKNKSVVQIQRFNLLGILSSGAYFTDEGEIIVKKIPTKVKPVSKYKVLIDIGVVIHAKKLLDFEALLFSNN